MVLIICEVSACLQLEGSAFVVGPPNVCTVKSGNYEQEMLSSVPLSTAL